MYGSDDGFSVPRIEFVDDEDIRISGYVLGNPPGNMSAGYVEFWLNGVFQGQLGLTYEAGTGRNLFSADLGALAVGTYTILIKFPRQRL
jgi:hypothetical protein